MADQPSMSGDEDGSSSAPDNGPPGLWRKVEILGRPVAALLTALTVALIGFFTNSILTTMSENEQNTRLYTELMSRREESESALRKDMFAAILKDFFKSDSQLPAHELIDHRLLKLELLALNFGESLSLSPLFVQLHDDINKRQNYQALTGSASGLFQDRHRGRLRGLARRVATRQLGAIQSRGASHTVEINYRDLPADRAYVWPRDESPPGIDPDMAYAMARDRSCMLLEGVVRLPELRFRNVSQEMETVQVQLTISSIRRDDGKPLPEGACEMLDQLLNDQHVVVNSDPPINFRLDYYNFPLVDNTLLDRDQRLAVVLQKLDRDEQQLRVNIVLFPGRFASRRDTPSLNEAVENLRADLGEVH